MRTAMLVAGVLLLLAGLYWIATVMIGIFARTPGATDLSTLAVGLAIHTVAMVLGMFLINRAVARKPAA
jgi:hypothetical protein